MPQPYLLLVDDEEDILEIQEGLLSVLGFERIITSTGVTAALEVIQKEGHPYLIISDYKMPNGGGGKLYHDLMKIKYSGDFIVCSGSPKSEVYKIIPESVKVMDKIDMFQTFADIRKMYLGAGQEKNNEYLKIPVNSLIRLGIIPVDVFIMLSENKFIKIHREGDYLDSSDSGHLKTKGVSDLYLLKEDLPALVKQYDEFLDEKLKFARFKEDHSDEQSYLTDITASAVSLVSALGLNDETYQVCKKTVDLVYRSLAEDKNYETLFKIRDAESNYAKHIMNLSMFLCLCSAKLGWSYEGTFKKFILAAFMHDIELKMDDYDDISKFENPDGSLTDEGNKADYRNHPARVAQKAATIKGLPSDVVQIILEHHEKPDGTGFPRGLFAHQISPYSALFIFCEALLREHPKGEISKNDLNVFVNNNPQYAEKGALKKMVQQLIKEF